MKKSLMLVMLMLGVAAFTVGTSPAYAYISGWEFNLSGVVAGLGNHLAVDRLIASGSSSVAQSFDGDGIFNNGDTFTEGTLLTSFTYFNTANIQKPLGLTSGATTYNLYAIGTGLTGYATNVVTPSADPSTWSFEYVFNPGQNLDVYLDTDLDPTTTGSIKLATLTTVAPSGGKGPTPFLGGSGATGTTDLTTVFTYALGGVWNANGLDFASLPSGMFALGLIDTNNTVRQNTFGFTSTGFSAIVDSEGKLRVDVVPEPATMLLFGIGAAGMAVIRRKKTVA